MLEIKNVQGTMDTVPIIHFDIDTVYVRSNIKRIETQDFNGWQYDEIQYTYNEWVAISNLKIATLEEELTITQDAINELILLSMSL